MNEPIPLSEKLYLLGINPRKGGIISAANTQMDYVILGGLILEMFLTGNIRFENKRVKILNPESKNRLHLFILEKMVKKRRNLSVGRWINKFYFFLKHIRSQVQQNLVDKRLIQLNDRHFLFCKWKSPAILNRQVVNHLLDEIDGIICKGTESEEDLMLISMLQPAGLMKRVFVSKEGRNEAKRGIKKIMSNSQGSVVIEVVKAVAKSITAINTAQHTVA